MKYRGTRRRFVGVAALFLPPERAFAPRMSDGRPLCQLYESYSVVFDGTVVSIEHIDLHASISRGLGGIPHRLAT